VLEAVAPFNRVAPLVFGQFRFAAKSEARSLARCRPSTVRTDQLFLELGQAAEQ
jgi:hypothetical protein